MKAAFLLCFLALAVWAEDPKDPKDMDPLELIKYHGYQGSVINVETSDGYILNLYRIPRGRKDTSSAKRPAVLLLHGFETSAADWLIGPPERSAAYLFADGGFDVFVGSLRGSKYGRAHKSWAPTTDMFWQFGLDEMAKIDLPALVNQALTASGAKDLYLVAHSTGTTVAIASLANNAPLNKLVRQLHAVAPVVSMQNVQGPIKFLAPTLKNINTASLLFGVGELMPNPEVAKSWEQYVCTNPEKEETCHNPLLMLAGTPSTQLDAERLRMVNARSPGGVSVRTAVHLAQMISSFEYGFRMYDFGHNSLNILHYGTPQPPRYDAKKVLSPTYLYSSESDWLAEPLDVNQLQTLLNPTIIVSSTIVPSFNHMDFLWGNRAANEIYGPILVAMAQDSVLPPKAN